MICFRCGATVAESENNCPMCEQEFSAGATMAATPASVSKAREQSGRVARVGVERSDVTHQLSVDDIFDEFAADEEEFLAGGAATKGDDDTTATRPVPAQLPKAAYRDDSSPILGVASDDSAERGVDPQPIRQVPTGEVKLQTGPLPMVGREPGRRSDPARPPAARAEASAEAETVDFKPRRPSAPRREPPAAEAETKEYVPPRPQGGPSDAAGDEPATGEYQPHRASAPRPKKARSRSLRDSEPEPVTGQVVSLDNPKPLPELAPALEPDPSLIRPADAPRPVRATATMIAQPASSGPSVLAMAAVGVALGLAMATVAAIVIVVRQEDRQADARRERAVKRVQERLREAERLRHATPAPGAPAIGPDGCPVGMRRLDGPPPYCIDVYEHPGGRTLPRSNVTWKEAGKACASRGARLCTAGEWEAACRGEGNADYPYGPRFEAKSCNVSRTPGKPRDMAETGTHPNCKSAALIYDMSGNVAEWAQDGAYHGGSAESDAAGASCSAKVTPAPDASSPYVGFRCCKAPQGATVTGVPAAPPATAPAPAPPTAPPAPPAQP